MEHLLKPYKRTLLFVICDNTNTPLECLGSVNIEKIWTATAEPETPRSASLSEFFNVEITALSSYEFEKKKFKEEVAHLRQQFISPRVLCEQIAEEKLKQFTSDDDCLALKGTVKAGLVSWFGANLSSVLEPIFHVMTRRLEQLLNKEGNVAFARIYAQSGMLEFDQGY
ncbi:unnamed protein product [Dovyalis caffra]|uniref:GB1/RHD3-type G domain-containing protein n=1 Tax=Dovyalis caffra TaxID=77055 RepID=A0AAV1SAL8_9ROSI|nr:unnamed protein product [Dovyalis caffra]